MSLWFKLRNSLTLDKYIQENRKYCEVNSSSLHRKDPEITSFVSKTGRTVWQTRRKKSSQSKKNQRSIMYVASYWALRNLILLGDYMCMRCCTLTCKWDRITCLCCTAGSSWNFSGNSSSVGAASTVLSIDSSFEESICPNCICFTCVLDWI